jgi:hypothetical protein
MARVATDVKPTTAVGQAGSDSEGLAADELS